MSTEWISQLLLIADEWIVVYFLLLNGFYLALVGLSIPQIWRHWATYKCDDMSRYLRTHALPPVSIVVAAYNEEKSIRATTRCLLALHYSCHEVIVVNDGSSDATLDRLREEHDLYEVPSASAPALKSAPVRAYYRSRTDPRLLVVDKANGGKADAQNAGLAVASHPLVLFADADTLIEHDALLRLARFFVLEPRVAAAGATIRVANGCTIRGHAVEQARMPSEALPSIQVAEYLRAFLFGRLGFNALGGSLIISGAFGIYRREHLLALGGYANGSVAEDMELVVRLHRYLRKNRIPYMIPFISDPIAWTEVPSDLTTLRRQRERWHRGLIVTLWHNIDMLFNPRYGCVGMITYPFFFFGEMLAPVVEFVGVVLTLLGLYVGAVDVQFALLFFAACWGYGALVTLSSVMMEELTFGSYKRLRDFARMALCAMVEPFGYRQLTVLWRLTAFWNAARGSTTWGSMRRSGFAPAKAS